MLAVHMTPRSTFPDAFPSNTLFGAICRGMAELGDDPGALIDACAGKPPFFISSCFPFLAGKEPVYLYPMPMVPLPEMPDLPPDRVRDLRKVRWVDGNIFQKLSRGDLSPAGLLEKWKTLHFNKKAKILSESPLDHDICRDVDIPHNQINRLSTVSQQFYHTSGTHFANSGLWFLLDFQDPSWEGAVRASLCLLADQGIGPRRSSGQGAFSLSFSEFSLPGERDAPYLVSLSRFLPDDLSSFGGQIWYDIIPVRGRTQDGVAKKRILMLSEGAFFRNTGRPWYGRIACVRENPPMVEYGVAFTIGMRCA